MKIDTDLERYKRELNILVLTICIVGSAPFVLLATKGLAGILLEQYVEFSQSKEQ